MPVTHKKGGNIVLTCVEDNIIEEKEDYKDIGLCGFHYKLFEEEEGGGVREGLYGYNYLKHIIQLWKGDWVNQMAKLNEMVGMKNRFLMSGGNKRLRLVSHFKRQELWKCIGCILSAVKFGTKGHNIWSE